MVGIPVETPSANAAAFTALQESVGLFNRLATFTAFAGGLSGNTTQTGLRNSAFGYYAADALTSGNDNTAFGYNALTFVASANSNSAFGSLALQVATGAGNSAVGHSALTSVGAGSQNAAIGYQTAYNVSTGVNNVAVGALALFAAAGVSYNTAIGHSALFANTAAGNTAVGESAGFAITSATNFTAVGRRAAYTKTSGADCTFLGHQAGYSGMAGEGANTGIGHTALGAYSFGHNTSGNYNTGVGRASGWYNATGSNNTYFGYRGGYGNTTGGDNVSIGFYSGHNTATGSKNVFIGPYADSYVPDGTGMTASAVAGAGLAIGAYTYRVTFVLDGVETGLSEPPANVTTTNGNQQVNLAVIPTYTGPRTCSARKVYRTPVGGENQVYLVATIADNTTTTYSDTTADGSLGAQPTQISGSIGIGYQARPLKSKQVVFGSTSARINEVFLGPIDDTAPEAVSVGPSSASGTNVAGADVRIRGGAGTGTGAGGKVILAAAPAGSSGATQNALTDWVTLDGAGFLNIKETTSAAVATPAAGSINLFVEGGALKFRNSAGTVMTVTAT